MRTNWPNIGLALLVLGIFAGAAGAQSGGGYQVTQSVTATGNSAGGGPYAVQNTVGQPIAGGSIAGGGYRLYPGFWTPPDFAPTAAAVSVGGRVTRTNGQGIRNAVVTLMDTTGTTRTTVTGSFGYYRFDEVTSGGAYVVTVTGQKFSFGNPTRVIELTGELIDVDFIAEN